MAEAFAVLGIVASITQLVDLGLKVIHRLDEFQNNLDEVSKSFRPIKAVCALLVETLKKTKATIDEGCLSKETEKALLPVIEGCREQIQLLDSMLAKILPTSDDSWRQKGRKAISSLYNEGKVEKMKSTLQYYIQTLTYYHAAASSTLQPLTNARLVKIRQWLSAPDPSENYHRALKQRQAHTGVWFLESKEYAEWKTDSSSFIWLYGIPGCGKTILSSTIIQDVLQYCSEDPAKVVAYFYFKFDSQEQSTALMLKSLITQFSRYCIRIPKVLEALSSAAMNGAQQPSSDALMQTLQQLIKEFPAAYIILDALDECNGRAELLEVLEELAGWKLDNLHILVTSRKESDIEGSLETFVDERNTVCLQSALVNEDIRTFVRYTLSVDKRFKRWQKNEAVQQEVERTLMQKAHGMFRWAVCQLDAFEKCLSRSMVQKFLADLPGTLDETYDRILCGIDKAYSEYALHILTWLAFSARPLRIEEVTEVVACDGEGDTGFDNDKVLEDASDILKICSSLITISIELVVEVLRSDVLGDPLDERRGLGFLYDLDAHNPDKICDVVRLAHYSVKEYLVSERIRRGPAKDYSVQIAGSNTFIAKSCLGYLLQFQEPDLVHQYNIKSFKLAGYAAKSWTSHAQAAERSEAAMNRLIMKLFSLRDISLLITEAGADVNTQGGAYGTALQAASHRGHESVVERLLEAGAHVNAQGGEYGTALQAASHKGHERVVERLLEAGADVNAQGGPMSSALQAAACFGHENVVERLLETGADVNMQSGEGNALQMASSNNYNNVVKRLLKAGAKQ
ncbi:MAG: hypothetical protein M1816_005529 [Peltula sp. TS41687]|nr:MAG: hypothetical protein M1816_005529 [Peltula sp. TS41687]